MAWDGSSTTDPDAESETELATEPQTIRGTATAPDGTTPVLADRVIVLTGGTSGIGRAAARRLAERGATVAAVGRDEERGRSLEAATADASGEIVFHRADLADQAAVRDLGDELLASYPQIHALANNAGIARSDRAESPDGIELTLAVNHLAPFLLTHELLPRLRESASASDAAQTAHATAGRDDATQSTASPSGASGPARVVTTSSGLQYRGELDLEDLQLEAGYDGLEAYARTKLANAAFTLELAERLAAGAPAGQPPAAVPPVVANCFSPGFVRGTRIWTGAAWRSRVLTRLFSLVPGIGTDVETGGRRLVELLVAPEYGRENGVFVDEGEIRAADHQAQDPRVRQRLWERSAELVGVDPDWPADSS